MRNMRDRKKAKKSAVEIERERIKAKFFCFDIDSGDYLMSHADYEELFGQDNAR